MRSVEAAYLAKVQENELELDPVQLQLVKQLEQLRLDIKQRNLSRKSSALGWLLGKNWKAEPVKGAYIWGSVGRGKSMLMDLFYQSIDLKLKRRAHFHEFMADAQERIQAQRKAFLSGASKEEDPIPPVARALAGEAQLLCFDEFSVTDIADATILGRLFKGLFEAGTVIVCTSNVAPENLYKDGLNRQRFLPFIDLLQQFCVVYELDAKTDYRLEKLTRAPIYISPLDEKSLRLMDAAWVQLAAGEANGSDTLIVKGRRVPVPVTAAGMARFDFRDLCEQPLGAQDYLAIAKKYHTIFLDNVPMMAMEHRSAAKRFINLIDTLYDRKTKLVISAATNPHGLYQGKSGIESFEFQRTASRLIEMQSQDYLSIQKPESSVNL